MRENDHIGIHIGILHCITTKHVGPVQENKKQISC